MGSGNAVSMGLPIAGNGASCTLELKCRHGRTLEVSDNRTGDAPVLLLLLDQIPKEEPIGTVSGDGAYDTRACHDVIAGRNACAVMPVRRNAKPWKETSPEAGARNDTPKVTRYLGRTIWRKWSGYHRRSLAETKMGRREDDCSIHFERTATLSDRLCYQRPICFNSCNGGIVSNICWSSRSQIMPQVGLCGLSTLIVRVGVKITSTTVS